MVVSRTMKPKILPLEDYLRITRVIASVLDAVEARTGNACLFFAIAGAYILEQIYKRPARPVAGAAFYRVDDETGFTMAFSRMDKDMVQSDSKAFHCWVESDGMIIDFMAPLFQDNVILNGRSELVERRMFQKPMSAMATSPFKLINKGDYFLLPNPSLMTELFALWSSKAVNEDLLHICMRWYKRPPKAQPTSFHIGSNDGIQLHVKLKHLVVAGAW